MSAKKVDRTKIEATVKLKAYSIISDAVERGLGFGWARIWKRRDEPIENHADSRDAILETLENAVLTELCEVLEFDE